MIHIALAYYQANGNFVISSKQILVRTVIYGVGAWLIVFNGFPILYVILYQVFLFFIFFYVANLSIPKKEKIDENSDSKEIRKKLSKSGRKMVF